MDITESGTVEGLLAETKVTYTITPAEGEQIASVAVNGAKEVNYDAKTFTVGTNNLSITAEFKAGPDTSTEKPTDPSEEVPSTPDPETPNKPDVGNNNNNNGSNNSNNNNNNSNSGNSSNQTNPSGSNNNGNTQRTKPSKQWFIEWRNEQCFISSKYSKSKRYRESIFCFF